MKHTFYVNSHITYYVSMAAIKKLDISLSDVCFIISRGYNNNFPNASFCIDITDIYNEIDKVYLRHFYKIYAFIKKTDSLLKSKFGNENFAVYLPHTRHKLLQIIATNKFCKELHIIEEGITAYSQYFMSFEEKNIIKKIGKILFNDILNLGFGRFYYTKPFDLRKFTKLVPHNFFTISNKSFKGLPYNIIKVKIDAEDNFNFDISGKNILVLEGAVEQGNLLFKSLLDAIDKVLIENDFKELFIKYHPVQSTANRISIKELCELKVNTVEVISDDIAFEQIAVNNTNLKVFGFTTSLLFYAKEFGCEVKSYESLLLKDSLFQKFRKENNFNLAELLK